MTKMIVTDIDEAGNVRLDFAGFVGTECAYEEQRFRRELASLGLRAKPERSLPKDLDVQSSPRQRGVL